MYHFLPSLFQNNSHRGGWSLEEATPWHRRNHQEWVSVKVGCRAQGRGWGWRAERLPETPLLEVSLWRQVKDRSPVCQSELASLPSPLTTLPMHSHRSSYLLLGMGKGCDRFTSPGGGLSGGGGVSGGVPGVGHTSSGELLR